MQWHQILTAFTRGGGASPCAATLASYPPRGPLPHQTPTQTGLSDRLGRPEVLHEIKWWTAPYTAVKPCTASHSSGAPAASSPISTNSWPRSPALSWVWDAGCEAHGERPRLTSKASLRNGSARSSLPMLECTRARLPVLTMASRCEVVHRDQRPRFVVA